MGTIREIEREYYRRGQEDMAEELNNAAVHLTEKGYSKLNLLDILKQIGEAAGYEYWSTL